MRRQMPFFESRNKSPKHRVTIMIFQAKHILLAVLLSFGYSAANAQGVVVYKKDGTFITIPFEEFDRIDTYDYGEEPGAGSVTGEIVNKSFSVEGVSLTMVGVKAGTFEMGSVKGDADERPVHSVTITKDYYIGETEVTQAFWEAVTGYSPTKDGAPWITSYGKGDEYPAYNVSYEDVLSFIDLLNEKTGQTFRMPTEAEWEYAAKGGHKSLGYTYSGGNTVADVAWYEGNSSGKSHPVKTKNANELGIYDMSGNVWEWCADMYSESYYSESPSNDPKGPETGSSRVLRGGSFGHAVTYSRTSERTKFSPNETNNYFGFRLAMSAE